MKEDSSLGRIGSQQEGESRGVYPTSPADGKRDGKALSFRPPPPLPPNASARFRIRQPSPFRPVAENQNHPATPQTLVRVSKWRCPTNPCLSSRLKRLHAGNMKQRTNDHAVVGNGDHDPRLEQESHFRVADLVLFSVGKPDFKGLKRLPPQKLLHGIVIHRFAFQCGCFVYLTSEPIIPRSPLIPTSPASTPTLSTSSGLPDKASDYLPRASALPVHDRARRK